MRGTTDDANGDSPGLAMTWLQTMTMNRPVSQLIVENYASDMAQGRWRLTKEAISFNERGELDDGQHRLWAVIESGATIPLAVVWDAPNDEFEVIDSGRPRTTGQLLRMEGVPNGTQVAAAARMVLRYHMYPGIIWTGGAAAKVTRTQVLDYLADHHMDTANLHAVQRAHILTASSWVAFEHIITNEAPSGHRWAEFAHGTITGAGLSEGDPRLALRSYRGNGRWGAGQSELMAGVVAWNHWINQRHTQHIRTARGSLPMPKPQ